MTNTAERYLMLTPSGVWRTHAEPVPDTHCACLQSLMAASTAPRRREWLAAGAARTRLLQEALEEGWVQQSARRLHAPGAPLDHFLPHAIAGLSHTRTVALSSGDGFCLARTGYSRDQADTLCAVAVDFLDFSQRQKKRGLQEQMRAFSLFNGVDMLLPNTSFLLFWIDGNAYWLIIDDEPLVNNTALVQIVWALHRSSSRFDLA